MSNNFGSVEFEGEEIALTEMAYPTSRVLTEYGDHLQPNGGGDSWMVEYQADGVRADGSRVIVRWHFEIAREGEAVEGAYPYDTEAEDYDWDAVESVRPNPYADF